VLKNPHLFVLVICSCECNRGNSHAQLSDCCVSSYYDFRQYDVDVLFHHWWISVHNVRMNGVVSLVAWMYDHHIICCFFQPNIRFSFVSLLKLEGRQVSCDLYILKLLSINLEKDKVSDRFTTVRGKAITIRCQKTCKSNSSSWSLEGYKACS
jgi:hypothetical protein